ncbi:hypothetical protein Z950_81 [Sulfitobacter mediterraneus KCTC 32188]|nr:hypothetical protein Z950_81 [Sulfitobacter mediterraneus KCTC 32188]
MAFPLNVAAAGVGATSTQMHVLGKITGPTQGLYTVRW